MRQPPPSFQSRLDSGVDGITVELWPTISAEDAAATIASFYLSTWNDPISTGSWGGDLDATEAWAHAEDAMSGKVLPNTLESIAVTFAISGISRATTHQLVRSRVGAVFGQQGGRDNNWHNFNQRVPDTWSDHPHLVKRINTFRLYLNKLYQEALDAGIPYQDARYVLPMGLETSLVASYNLLSFKGLVERRLCNRMMWETNYVVRLMTDLVVKQFPFVGRNLRSSCEKRGVCGSVSPMFPPACFYYDKDTGHPRVAADNPTLRAEAGYEYDFQSEANGSWRHFAQIDRDRLEKERDPQIITSMLSDQIIARKDSEGLWNNG